MQERLKEMIMVVRPTAGNGMIPLNELDTILQQIGYDFLLDKRKEISKLLDQGGSGFFDQDELVDYLATHHAMLYSDRDQLIEAIKMFDYDNDNKIKYDELEYFMSNFGESESSYFD